MLNFIFFNILNVGSLMIAWYIFMMITKDML